MAKNCPRRPKNFLKKVFRNFKNLAGFITPLFYHIFCLFSIAIQLFLSLDIDGDWGYNVKKFWRYQNGY